MTIRTKVTLLATFSVAIALAITATAAVVSIAGSTRSQILQAADRSLGQAETALGIFTQSQLQVLHSLVLDPGIWRDPQTWTSYAETKADTKTDPGKYSPAEAAVASRFETLRRSFDATLQIEVGTSLGTYIMVPPGTKPAGYDPRKRPWYTAAVPGKAASTGARRTTGGDLAISYVEPLSLAGATGVVSLTVSLATLTQISAELKIGSHGFVMVFQPDGTVLTSVRDPALVGKNVAADHLDAFGSLDLTKDGQGTVSWLGSSWDVLIRPASGLVYAAFLDPREYQDEVQAFLVLMVVLSLVVLVLAALVAAGIAASLSRPLTRVAAQLKSIAEGDFQHQWNPRLLASGGELGHLSRSLRNMVEVLEEKAHILETVAGGDLRVEIPLASDTDRLGLALQLMARSLKDLLGEINEAVEQLTSGAGQIATGSQSVAQGATEQAASLEELAAVAVQVAGQSKKNAETAEASSQMARRSRSGATEGRSRMNELLKLLENMTRSSEDTKKIIRTIDDIAFQVNLLALNANVEAARAGKYGKGFGVVAEEVRSLAARSAKAVQDTTKMVEENLKSILMVNSTAQKTGVQLEVLTTESEEVADALDEILGSSREQSRALGTVSDGLAQMDTVTQASTASAEQSAAAAQQLASQANHLRELVGRFQLH